eukprot:1335765-Amphidinium_carterae.1
MLVTSWYFQKLHAIPDGRIKIFNLETAVWLTLVSDRGWREWNRDAVRFGDTRLVTTVTLVMPYLASRKWYTQVLFAGKTSCLLPEFDAASVHLDHTELHWQSAQSLLKLSSSTSSSTWMHRSIGTLQQKITSNDETTRAVLELNPGPLAPDTRITPLDQTASDCMTERFFKSGKIDCSLLVSRTRPNFTNPSTQGNP